MDRAHPQSDAISNPTRDHSSAVFQVRVWIFCLTLNRITLFWYAEVTDPIRLHPLSDQVTSCAPDSTRATITAPQWNDKFIFRVDESFIKKETSAIMVDIYCTRWFRDTLVGSVRVLVSNFLPAKCSGRSGVKCNAVQVWRPSGRPQGILNISLAVLDAPIRSVPVYTHLDSAVGCRDLMEDGFGKMRRNRSAYDLDDSMVQEEDDYLPELKKLGKALSFGGTESVVDGSMVEYHHAEVESSVENWSVTSGGVREELRRKLEKWRAELPSVYDFRLDELERFSIRMTSPGGSIVGRSGRGGGGGLFACFNGGFQISITCGVNPKKHRR